MGVLSEYAYFIDRWTECGGGCFCVSCGRRRRSSLLQGQPSVFSSDRMRNSSRMRNRLATSRPFFHADFFTHLFLSNAPVQYIVQVVRARNFSFLSTHRSV